MGVQEQVSGIGSRLTPLCALAKRHGTDKYPWYTPFYDSLLWARRENIRYVLEVGIGTPKTMLHVNGYEAGASLRMWSQYFPKADIFGLDIDENALQCRAGRRIITEYCDQRSVESLDSVFGNLSNIFDLIVDDGSHDPGDQLRTYICLSRLLSEGGLYIIEDAHPSLINTLPVPHQYVECRVPGNDTAGLCVVIQSS